MTAAQQFIGTWQLVSQYNHYPDGECVPSRGKNPQGLLMYDAYLNMSVQLIRTDEERGLFTDLRDIHTAMQGFLAYFGTYEVDSVQNIVKHHLHGASFSAYQGTTQVRHYHFEGDQLTLKAASPLDDATRILVWQRVTAALK